MPRSNPKQQVIGVDRREEDMVMVIIMMRYVGNATDPQRRR